MPSYPKGKLCIAKSATIEPIGSNRLKLQRLCKASALHALIVDGKPLISGYCSGFLPASAKDGACVGHGAWRDRFTQDCGNDRGCIAGYRGADTSSASGCKTNGETSRLLARTRCTTSDQQHRRYGRGGSPRPSFPFRPGLYRCRCSRLVSLAGVTALCCSYLRSDRSYGRNLAPGQAGHSQACHDLRRGSVLRRHAARRLGDAQDRNHRARSAGCDDRHGGDRAT